MYFLKNFFNRYLNNVFIFFSSFIGISIVLIKFIYDNEKIYEIIYGIY